MTAVERSPLERPALDCPGLDRSPPAAGVRWRRTETTLWRRTLDGVVVLPFDLPVPLVLRGSAARMWELLAQPQTFAELLEAIAEIYGVESDAIAGEVGSAVAKLADAGALCRL